MWWFSAFVVGFLGSIPCVGMCGPIAMALPVENSSSNRQIIGRMLYNSGRVVTYSALGLLAGWFGHSLATAGFQQSLSILSGLLLLILAVWPMVSRRSFYLETIVYKLTGRIKNIFRRLFRARGNTTLFLIGLVNGILPCGFVYLALAGAATSSHALDGMLYMLFFGLGTLPAMLSLSMATSLFSPAIRRFFSAWTPYVAILLAVLLLYRGFTIVPASCCRLH